MLATWRKQRERAEQAALAPRKRGPKANPALAEARELKKLQEQNARLRRELERAHTIIDVQKKTVHRAWTVDRAGNGRRTMMEAFHQLEPQVGIAAACAALSIGLRSTGSAHGPCRASLVRRCRGLVRPWH